MTDSSNSSSAKPSFGLIAAGCAAAFVSAMVVSISAPSLTRPIYPGVLLVVCVPFLSGAVFCWIAGMIGRLFSKSAEVPTVPAMVGAFLGATPWLLIAGSPIARAAWIAWVGLIVVLLLARQNARRGLISAGISLAAGVFVVGLGSDFSFHPETDTNMSPVVVLGLDSATWDQIDPMIAEGELPNMKRLLERSARAQLDSEDPTLSARIWTIIATGRTAEDNGILDFECTRRDLKTGRVWDAVHESDGSVGITGWLMTWPPDEFPGFCMPGWVAPGAETHPMDLAFLKPLVSVGRKDGSLLSMTTLNAALSGVAISTADHTWENLVHFWGVVTARGSHAEVREATFWRMQLVFANLSSDAWFEQMIRYNPVFGALLITPVDTLGHHYWSSHEPSMFPDLAEEKKLAYAEVLRDGYRKTDDVLGRLMERVDMEETTFMIFSDHGMEALGNGGRNTAKPSPIKMIQFIGLEDVGLRAAVAGNQLVMTCNEKNAERNHELLGEVRDRISSIRVEEKPEGRPFRFSPFEDGDQTLSMNFIPKEIDGNGEYHLVFEGERKAVKELFYQESRSGVHHKRGVVIISGPGVKAGTTFENASIYDAAPTMLYGLGLEVPAGLPGKVLTDAWDPSHVKVNPVKSTPGFLPEPPPARDLELNEEMRLKALESIGYIEGSKKKKE